MLPKCFYLVMLIVVSPQLKGKCFIREFFSQFSIVPYHRIDMYDHEEWGARRREDSRELTTCDAHKNDDALSKQIKEIFCPARQNL